MNREIRRLKNKLEYAEGQVIFWADRAEGIRSQIQELEDGEAAKQQRLKDLESG